ncbi:MAG: DUF3261 domain-containing protein [bacterium]
MGLLVGGCARTPFQPALCLPVKGLDPRAVREQFSRLIPEKFQLVNTIVFTYGQYTFSAIGYTDIDSQKNAFTVAGINPLGVKLFELAGDSQGVECRFALEEFARHGNFAQAVADDIRRIYFDRLPSPEARVRKKKYRIIFRQPGTEGTLEYVFAGADNLLVEKNCYQENNRLWSISYYEYQQKDGKFHPTGIILNNHHYHYRLTLRLKEIRS